MENYFNNLNLLKLVLKWKWHLVVIVIIAGILAVIFSGKQFITPKFKATAIVYPSNIEPYSDESETEQMLQWFNSKDIKDSVIDKFNLGDHYKIKPGNKYYRTVLLNEYKENVSISKTQYESVEIEVMDKNPEMAHKMVNAIIHFFNKKVRHIQTEKFEEMVEVNRKMLKLKEEELDSVKGRLRELSQRYELVDYISQASEVTKGHLGTVEGSGARINKQAVRDLKENLEEHGSELLLTQERFSSLTNEYHEAKKLYDEALRYANREFTYTNMVTSPEVPDRKAYPKRWLILLYAVVGAFLMALIIISIIENKHIAQELKKEDE
ncbi:MAG: hypothetical protein K9I94_00325 [Bacteroidales bacterium]|nr:hypothetical protein [Bacteroidales bacterium]